MASLAVVLVAGTITERMLQRVYDLNPHELVIVGQYHRGDGYRYLPVPMQGPASVVARMRRDVATLATTSTHLLFLEGRTVAPGWGVPIKRWLNRPGWDILLPARVEFAGFTDPWDGVAEGAIYTREILARVPFGLAYPGPRWSHWHTEACRVAGARFQIGADLWLEQIVTGVTPSTVRYRKGLRAKWRERPPSRWVDPTLPERRNHGSPSWSALCARLLEPTRYSKPGAFSATPPPISPPAFSDGAGDA